MKSLFVIGLFVFSVSAWAQQEGSSTNDDRLQQEPPREAQNAVERASRQADVNEQNNKNVINSQDKLQSETERSTGKEMKNPALENPTTVNPPQISDPVSTPVSKQLNPGR